MKGWRRFLNGCYPRESKWQVLHLMSFRLSPPCLLLSGDSTSEKQLLSHSFISNHRLIIDFHTDTWFGQEKGTRKNFALSLFLALIRIRLERNRNAKLSCLNTTIHFLSFHCSSHMHSCISPPNILFILKWYIYIYMSTGLQSVVWQLTDRLLFRKLSILLRPRALNLDQLPVKENETITMGNSQDSYDYTVAKIVAYLWRRTNQTKDSTSVYM